VALFPKRQTFCNDMLCCAAGPEVRLSSTPGLLLVLLDNLRPSHRPLPAILVKPASSPASHLPVPYRTAAFVCCPLAVRNRQRRQRNDELCVVSNVLDWLMSLGPGLPFDGRSGLIVAYLKLGLPLDLINFTNLVSRLLAQTSRTNNKPWPPTPLPTSSISPTILQTPDISM
jgi:hypothetical protein